MNAPLYTTEILRLAASLPDPAPLDRPDGTSSERSPTCGSTVAAEVKLSGGRVEALSLRVQACAFGQASAALVAGHAAGRTRQEVGEALEQLRDWLQGESDQPPSWPGYVALSPARSRTARHGAILLPLRALAAAMDSAK